jgi:hypothetical protein
MVDAVRSRRGELSHPFLSLLARITPIFFSTNEDDNTPFLHTRYSNRPLGRRIYLSPCPMVGGELDMPSYELGDFASRQFCMHDAERSNRRGTWSEPLAERRREDAPHRTTR